MRSNRFLIVILLVLVHSFISCDGAAYHLQEDVDHVTSSLSQGDSTADDNQSDKTSTTEIHAHQHCHCGYNSTSSHSISPEQSKATSPACYNGLNYPPDVPPPNFYS
ncbi:hypothetical protein I6F50_11610 [Pseudoalteromonas sp. NZS127_1]|uniref:Orphan protein n=1 Tax=Pseudoalteromonas arctica TaxID=394751 RepID=A0ABU9TI05_9GAMM|nr:MULTISPECIES: hypothetical protein [Pseudoalteromonas]KDC51469.1 hypothetical protein DO88_15995 [Pseudoalteromonas sp. S3431]MBG9995713.1 hypothetical protein [Pseudoalteromonas sp. NZS127_1]MBG9999825.1 hypothetical protein [Pseudoalteromonas sp. NSLLW24]MBH0014019.1 hypothetical protein [Pseudoalteromonas sp. NZS100_1]MBH0017210.1 hypothetical protein [Pseudoalteromonas sp. NGC95]